MPVISATAVITTIVVTARASAPTQYPATMPPCCGAASISRRANPDSKSRAIENPVNTPPKADAWSSTKPYTKAV